MTEIFALLGFVVFILVVLSNSNLVLGFLAEKILEPGTKWFMRVFLGIDTPRTGLEAMVGRVLRIDSDFRESDTNDGKYIGTVMLDGERWKASSSEELVSGCDATVKAVENLTIKLEMRHAK